MQRESGPRRIPLPQQRREVTGCRELSNCFPTVRSLDRPLEAGELGHPLELAWWEGVWGVVLGSCSGWGNAEVKSEKSHFWTRRRREQGAGAGRPGHALPAGGRRRGSGGHWTGQEDLEHMGGGSP